MTFAHPWVWPLLALLVLWTLWEARRTTRPLGLAIKALALAAALLALTEPALQTYEDELAVAVLTDASSSIPPEQRAEQRQTVATLAAGAGEVLLRPLAFDEQVRRGVVAGQTAGIAGTNLEVAIRSALATLPAERAPRVALFTDGLETAGVVERAVDEAIRRGAVIDVFPLEGRQPSGVRVLSVEMPDQAFAGERIPIEVLVESDRATPAEVRLTADGKSLGFSAADLDTGPNRLLVRARLETPGASLIEGRIVLPGGEQTSFAGAVSFIEPRALLLSYEPALSERHLEQVFEAAGFAIERASGPAVLRDADELRERYDVLVVNNLDYEKWAPTAKVAAEEFVARGGGFLVVSGERNMYTEEAAEEGDPLNRMLPATLAPPRTPDGAVVVLVLDKSSSMEGRKMQLARQSAMGVIDSLRPVDQVGVLVFDNSHQWAVPIRKNDDPGLIKRLIAGVVADGGTQIAPALREAYEQIRPQEGLYKHILLLTDGISEEGDSIQLAREAARFKVTISTIGLGQDVNRAYLERVAEMANGRSYLVIDVAQLAQVVLRDVLEHTGSSLTEEEFYPEVLTEAEILEGVSFNRAGPLLGWVRYEAKAQAETILQVNEEDPLLVRWQYGLGRAAVFSSDAKNRWAARWLAWEGFDRFWTNVVRDLLPRSQPTEADVRHDRASGELVASYRMRPELEPEDLPEIYVLGEQGYRATAPLERIAAGSFEARVPVGRTYGLFRIRPAAEQRVFPEAAFYRENQELQLFGAQEPLLRGISAATGGRYDPDPREVFRPAARSVQKDLPLWPGLLALAIALNLLELIARKGWLPFWKRWA